MTKLIVWQIDIDVATPRAADEQARAIQRNPESIVTVFDVTDRKGKTVRVHLAQDNDTEDRHVRVRQP